MTDGNGDITEQSERPDGRSAGETPQPTLDRFVAEHGPLPEGAVRSIGERLAAALAAVHALRQEVGDLRPQTVLMYSDGPRLGPAHPPAGGTANPPGEVYALAGVLVFAATGRAPSADQGLDDVPAGLRTVLARCLSDDPADRPSAGELASSLAAAPAAENTVLLPSAAGIDAQTMPVLAESAAAQHHSSNRLPWTITAVCGALIVVVLATVGIVVAQRGSEGGSDPGGNGGTTKYTSAGLGDACALLDQPAVERVIGKSNNTPRGDIIELPMVADSLNCSTMHENGFILLHIEVSDQLETVRSLYDGHRADGLGTTGSGVTTEQVSDIGEDAYLVVHEPNKGDSSKISCMLGFLEANVVAIVNVYLSEDDGTTRDELEAICRHQSETVLGRLK
ncbi:hypothetical protein ABZ319_17780 [Nocardia sp. NPDC005978]|uniref:hypothetical protein n=1 Tax=Nocardia sp. NPDC005978 TaxID=3156725 RepID=UPI0033B3B381